MTVRTRVDAQIEFSVSLGESRMEGILEGAGSRLTLQVSDPRLLGGTGTEPARVLAARLAEQGLELSIAADRPLVVLGVRRAPFWHRRVTGSPHIRLASLAAAGRLLRLRRASGGRTPLVPPPTPVPLAPTFLRRPRRPTTTHDPDKGGYPRLVLPPDPHHEATRQVFHLGDRTLVGSHPACDIVLEGLRARHAEIVRTEEDEFVVRPLQQGRDVQVHGAVVLREALLRTGARVDLGPRTLVYAREELVRRNPDRPGGGEPGSGAAR